MHANEAIFIFRILPSLFSCHEKNLAISFNYELLDQRCAVLHNETIYAYMTTDRTIDYHQENFKDDLCTYYRMYFFIFIYNLV